MPMNFDILMVKFCPSLSLFLMVEDGTSFFHYRFLIQIVSLLLNVPGVRSGVRFKYLRFVIIWIEMTALYGTSHSYQRTIIAQDNVPGIGTNIIAAKSLKCEI